MTRCTGTANLGVMCVTFSVKQGRHTAPQNPARLENVRLRAPGSTDCPGLVVTEVSPGMAVVSWSCSGLSAGR
jgi:hypothetical protein